MTDDKAAWRRRSRRWARDYLGGVCVVCGTTEGLQFDHIDPATKSFAISVALRDGMSKARVKVELNKCQLLCQPHHREKTMAEGSTTGGYNKVVDPQHGTAVMYASGCRCFTCRRWKNLYRAKIVDARGVARV